MVISERLRKALLFGFAIVVIILLVIAATRKPSIDVRPEDSTSTDYTFQARIVDGEKLYAAIADSYQYDQLSTDLFTFAEQTYDAYKNSNKVVGFDPDDDSIQSSAEEVSFKGKYGSSDNTIEVRLKKLKNSRIENSITDTKTRTNIDANLPSNSQRNKYIATLPATEGIYTAEYDVVTDQFTLIIYSSDRDEADRAIDDFSKKLGVSDLSKERVSIINQGSPGRGSFAE